MGSGPLPNHTEPECVTTPIRYVALHFRHRRGTVALSYRNRAEITVLTCKQKRYLV